MYHEDIFYPFLPMFSTFDGKMVNVVENAECFPRRTKKCPVRLSKLRKTSQAAFAASSFSSWLKMRLKQIKACVRSRKQKK